MHFLSSLLKNRILSKANIGQSSLEEEVPVLRLISPWKEIERCAECQTHFYFLHTCRFQVFSYMQYYHILPLLPSMKWKKREEDIKLNWLVTGFGVASWLRCIVSPQCFLTWTINLDELPLALYTLAISLCVWVPFLCACVYAF